MSWTGMCMDFSISGCADWGTECAQSPPWIWEGQIGAGGYGGPHVSCPPGQVWSDVNGCHSPFIGGDPDPQTDLLGYVYFTTNYETGQQVCMSGNQECAWDFSTSTHTAWDAQSCCIQQGMSQTNYTLEYDQCELMGYPDYHVCFYTSVNPVRSIRPIR
jgi:hypothetical protein